MRPIKGIWIKVTSSERWHNEDVVSTDYYKTVEELMTHFNRAMIAPYDTMLYWGDGQFQTIIEIKIMRYNLWHKPKEICVIDNPVQWILTGNAKRKGNNINGR